jgi:hypothetical protein
MLGPSHELVANGKIDSTAGQHTLADLRNLLFGIAVALCAVDCTWASLRHFDIDLVLTAKLAVLSLLLAASGMFYERIRKCPELGAMFNGAAFLVAFSASSIILNQMLLTVAGTRIDATLAWIDRQFGVDWPALMNFVSLHSVADWILQLAYVSVGPQITMLLLALGLTKQPEQIYKFCLVLSLATIITMGFWAIFPSFGAFSVYELPEKINLHLAVALDSKYAHHLVARLANGPGRISPSEDGGLIGFPSFHSVMALVVVWYSRYLPRLWWPAVVLNLVVLVATPIQGGHHVVDVFGGICVLILSICLTERAPSFMTEFRNMVRARGSIARWNGHDPSAAREA